MQMDVLPEKYNSKSVTPRPLRKSLGQHILGHKFSNAPIMPDKLASLICAAEACIVMLIFVLELSKLPCDATDSNKAALHKDI